MNHLHNTLLLNATIQLKKEYAHICYQYNLKLKEPLIIIDDLGNSFGKWDANRRTIFLSEALILQYNWDKVLSVLKHEMAHQIVTQIFQSEDSHGNDFQKACAFIGLEGFYTKPQMHINQDFADWRNENDEEESSVLRKVEKLLSLSNSSNEHESYLAMAKVKDLIKKYNLEMLSKNFTSKHVTLTIDLKLRRVPSKVFYVSEILQEHYFVSTIFSKIYSPESNTEYRSLVLMGEKHNILMAEYVYEFLMQQTESLWKLYKTKEKLSAKYKGSYQKGILEGFKQKLDSLKNTPFNSAMPISEEKSLIKTYNNKLALYVKTQFPKTSSIHQAGLIYKDHYDQGSQDGKRMNISKPIAQKKPSSFIRLLTSGAHK